MSKPKELPFEVLPPDAGRDQPQLSRVLAWILDDLIPIPGTKYRIGLDPIIGLIPGLGDSSTAVASSMILLNAVRAGVPRVALARMAVNIFINSVVGAFPGLGDIFSAWFKSNKRNYEILKAHQGLGSRRSSRGDWIFVIVFLIFLFAFVVAATIFVGWWGIQVFQVLTTR